MTEESGKWLLSMREEETASAMCGRARQASDHGDDGKAQMLFMLFLAKAEEDHGAESMMVALVLRSLVVFHQTAGRADDADESEVRLNWILKKRGVMGAEMETIWLPKGLSPAGEA